VNLQPTEEQKLLRESVAKFCAAELPMLRVRSLAEEPGGLTAELWRKIAEQAWLGVLVPEEHGGLGLGVTELGIVTEEMGRALVPGPYLACAALAAAALALSESDRMKRRWLEPLAAGDARGTVALLEAGGQLGARHVAAAARKTGGGYRLEGKKFFVSDLAASDFAVAAARTGSGEEDVLLFLVETAAPGVSVERNALTDSTSRSGQLILEGVEVPAEAVLGGWDLARRVLRVANVALAGSSVAGAERVLETAVAYARTRKQFGVPIGSFQAVKHPLANVFAEIESARSAYHYAAWAVDSGSPDVESAVAIARLTCTGAYRNAALTSLQAHGGIGFTWEYDLHLHLKRALHNQCLLGVDSDYEDLIAREALGI
jgi:alkylation response protein AidB-like acyl-CoA dehydrogenase